MNRRELLAGLSLGAAAAWASGPVRAQTADAVPPGRLFVINAASGQLEGQLLSLSDVEPFVTWFEDRPGRGSGSESVASFVRDWSGNGFGTDPPNAVLQTGSVSLPVVLRNPVLAGSSLRFEVAPDQGARLADWPTTFGANSLFIDAGAAPIPPNFFPVSLSYLPITKSPSTLQIQTRVYTVMFSDGPPLGAALRIDLPDGMWLRHFNLTNNLVTLDVHNVSAKSPLVLDCWLTTNFSIYSGAMFQFLNPLQAGVVQTITFNGATRSISLTSPAVFNWP